MKKKHKVAVFQNFVQYRIFRTTDGDVCLERRSKHTGYPDHADLLVIANNRAHEIAQAIIDAAEA